MFFGTFAKNVVGIAEWIHIQVFYSVPLVFIPGFVLVPFCFYCCGSEFEVGYCDNSTALFAQYYLGLFMVFSYNIFKWVSL
jgi:RsiW-degrading membrane proteinase PrsW (M82 family)